MDAVAVAQWALRIALAAAFAFMGISHFVPRVVRTMAAMIPDALRRDRFPTPRHLVWFTGVCELAGAIGLLVPATRFAAGVCLVVFLLAVFPANVRAARDPARFKGAAIPIVPRYFGQLALIVAILFAIA